LRIDRVLTASLVALACAGPNGASSGAGPAGGELAASVGVEVRSDSVRFGFHVTNVSRRVLHFTFPTSQRYDFIVETESGEPVWRWSEGRAFAQGQAEVRLEPGESWDMRASWIPRDLSGRFVVTGQLASRAATVRQQAAFELP